MKSKNGVVIETHLDEVGFTAGSEKLVSAVHEVSNTLKSCGNKIAKAVEEAKEKGAEK